MDSAQLANETIAKHLFHIELILGAILVLLLMGVLVRVYVLCFRMPRQFENACSSTDLVHQLRDLLDRGQFDKAIELAAERVSTHPNDVQAHWYLARAYTHKEDWFQAIKHFNTVSRIQPNWNDQYVAPYVKEIQVRIKHVPPDNLGPQDDRQPTDPTGQGS